MKTGLAETNIFKSNSQLLHHAQAESIKPVLDRVLLRDIKDPDKIESIWIPETAAERGLGKNGLIRLGEVVAVGPGDKFSKEWLVRDQTTGTHQVMRKALGVCLFCHGTGRMGIPDIRTFSLIDDGECILCNGDGIRRWPMYCKVGDLVVYDVRREAEFYINGERHSLVHEEQAILAILS